MDDRVDAKPLPAGVPANALGDGVYCGRFAPSPTGPLHFGSLLAALASCLEARVRAGRWLLRIDDLDTPRCTQAASDAILRSLERHGFVPDAEPLWQSRRQARYAEALAQLQAQGEVYPCACTRRELADSQLAPRAPDGASIYPGTCRHGLPAGRSGRAWRLRVSDTALAFDDALQGPSRTALASEVGDFVVRRADGLYAYQLATVVDDADSGVTEVVRGVDLFASTPRQIWLQQRLGLPTPRYAHLPVACNAAGEKLSKQTRAPSLDDARPVATLHDALAFLGQQPPPALRGASLAELWDWARAHWQLGRVPRGPSIVWEPDHATTH